MDDVAIVALLSSVEPSEGEIPKPPFMAAIPAGPVIEAGADLDAVDAWVKARGGWTHRVPAHLAGPGGDRAPLFFIVPKGHLQTRPGAPSPYAAPGSSRGAPGPFLPGGSGRASGGGAMAPLEPMGGRTAGGMGPGGRTPEPFEPVGGSGGRPFQSGVANAELTAFAATTDMGAAQAFYGRALGLPVTGKSPIACTFDANGTTLRVVLVEKATVAPYTVLGWTVPDITATIGELIGRGIDFERIDGIEQDELGIWSAPGGAKVAWFKDPDGHMLSLTQF
jgi:catechol 2,3-dioxygenase-like lactoylglutathione lyase family enzyme